MKSLEGHPQNVPPPLDSDLITLVRKQITDGKPAAAIITVREEILSKSRTGKDTVFESLKLIASLGVLEVVWPMIRDQGLEPSSRVRLSPNSVDSHLGYFTVRSAIRGLLNFGDKGATAVKETIPNFLRHPYIATGIKKHFVRAIVQKAYTDNPVDTLGSTAGLGLQEFISRKELRDVLNASLNELAKSDDPLPDPELIAQIKQTEKELL